MKRWDVIEDDCVECIKPMRDCSVDSVITDPPYGIAFMGKAWDKNLPEVEVWKECLRVLKPGGHLLAFGSPRTFHRLACSIEDSGFELRDTLNWLYGTGFPKSKQHLKPGWEPILMFRKPSKASIKKTVEEYGTGNINIEECRIATEPTIPGGYNIQQIDSPTYHISWNEGASSRAKNYRENPPSGRYPPNVCMDEEAAKQLDDEIGTRKSGRLTTEQRKKGGFAGNSVCYGNAMTGGIGDYEANEGPPSRFYYVPKATRGEKEAGLEKAPNNERLNNHPTVKPIELLRWLCRLITPENGLILDPFCGTGTTGIAAILESRQFLGIECEKEYVEISKKRINHWDEFGYLK